MTWACLGASVLSVPLFALMRVDYYRLDVDTTPTKNSLNEESTSNSSCTETFAETSSMTGQTTSDTDHC